VIRRRGRGTEGTKSREGPKNVGPLMKRCLPTCLNYVFAVLYLIEI